MRFVGKFSEIYYSNVTLVRFEGKLTFECYTDEISTYHSYVSLARLDGKIETFNIRMLYSNYNYFLYLIWLKKKSLETTSSFHTIKGVTVVPRRSNRGSVITVWLTYAI